MAEAKERLDVLIEEWHSQRRASLVNATDRHELDQARIALGEALQLATAYRTTSRNLAMQVAAYQEQLASGRFR